MLKKISLITDLNDTAQVENLKSVTFGILTYYV